MIRSSRTVMAMAAPFGRLLSIDVVVPRNVEWEGRTVDTSMRNEPVEGNRT
jgi:hypothetical protein